MRKKFFKTFFQACSDSFSNPLLFWYGFLLFFPITTGYFLVFLFANNSPWVSSPLYTNSIFFFPLTFILSLWGKNKLILSLDSLSKKKEKKKEARFLQKFFSLFRLSFLFFFLSFVVILILSMPLSMYWANTKEISSTLFALAFVTYLPISFILFLVEEFSFFYISLSELSFRSALENGARIFLKYPWVSALYCFFLFLILSVFTFFFNIGMLGIVALLQKKTALQNPEASFLLLALLFAIWIIIVKHAFYIIFFKEIATPKEPTTKLKEDVLLETTLKDFPPA